MLLLLWMLVVMAPGLCEGVAVFTKGKWLELQPEVQNIPEDPMLSNLRPPPPRIPENPTVFIGLSGFRDARRCAYTVFTALKFAARPDKLTFGVVDQELQVDKTCLAEYCRLAEEAWGTCRHKEQVRVKLMEAAASRGPTLARHYQQQLLHDEDFCLQLDAHSVFTPKWDDIMLEDFAATGNEMAVISTYIQNISHIGDNEYPKNEDQHPHLCNSIRVHGGGLYRNEAAASLLNTFKPQMTALWGAGLSFSKCHAERRAPVDPHTPWLFDGEEFLRASHLWTRGYDMYSPSTRGTVVFHNYTSVSHRFQGMSQLSQTEKMRLEELGKNRFRLEVGLPFEGMVDARDMPKFGYGHVRTFESYLRHAGFVGELSEVTDPNRVRFADTCRQLHWVPYENPREVEDLLPGWRMEPPFPPSADPVAVTRVLPPQAAAAASASAAAAAATSSPGRLAAEMAGMASGGGAGSMGQQQLEAAMVEVAQERAIAALLAHAEALVLLLIILVFAMRLRSPWRREGIAGSASSQRVDRLAP